MKIVFHSADNLSRKAMVHMGKGFLDMMKHGRRHGDSIRVDGVDYVISGHAVTADGLEIDLTPGTEA